MHTESLLQFNKKRGLIGELVRDAFSSKVRPADIDVEYLYNLMAQSNLSGVVLIFGRNNKPISLAIQFITWSQWSHVGILLEETGEVLEAVGGKGVIITPLKDFYERYTLVETGIFWCENPQEAIDKALTQKGKDYDTKALFGRLFRTGWHSMDSWICSELIAWASGRFKPESHARITPEDLWRLCK